MGHEVLARYMHYWLQFIGTINNDKMTFTYYCDSN